MTKLRTGSFASIEIGREYRYSRGYRVERSNHLSFPISAACEIFSKEGRALGAKTKTKLTAKNTQPGGQDQTKGVIFTLFVQIYEEREIVPGNPVSWTK